MSLLQLNAAGIEGVDGYLVQVEVSRHEPASGKGKISVVGLPDAAIRESIDRIIPALGNSSILSRPSDCITVNLAPAHRKKEGPAFDLAIAVGIAGTIDDNNIPPIPDDLFFYAELALDGKLRPVRGALPATLAAKKEGKKRVILAKENADEASVIEDMEIYPCEHIKDVIDILRGKQTAPHPVWQNENTDLNIPDMSDVKGQENAKRALMIAAAGGHNMLMIGPPGSGKTMLAKRLPGILPPMTNNEALEATRIHSVAGTLASDCGLITNRPFRAPHHNISDAGLIGGGTMPRPGEVTLSHNGVLFLDELPEFNRKTLETLRQPLEDGELIISRAWGRLTFPSKCMLIAAMNPCPCGYQGHPTRRCKDTYNAVQNYKSKISGPLLDRIDIHLEVPAQRPEKLDGESSGETSATMRERIKKARNKMLERQSCPNALMTTKEAQTLAKPEPDALELLHQAINELGLSARAYNRICKVSKTISDLDNRDTITIEDISEAIGYRLLDRQ